VKTIKTEIIKTDNISNDEKMMV